MEPAASSDAHSAEHPAAPPLQARRVLLSLLAFLSLIAVASGVIIGLVAVARLVDRAV